MYYNQGRKVFELSLYNFNKPKIKCNHNPHGCGSPGDYQYSDYWANITEKATCSSSSQDYAWKKYDCYLKFVQDGMTFKDDYKFYEHKSSSYNNEKERNYWN